MLNLPRVAAISSTTLGHDEPYRTIITIASVHPAIINSEASETAKVEIRIVGIAGNIVAVLIDVPSAASVHRSVPIGHLLRVKGET